MKVYSVLKCFKRNKNAVVPVSNEKSIESTIKKISNNWVENNEIEYNNKECIICLENINQNDLTLPCMHRFHKECVKKWHNESKNLWCPVCKYPFKEKLIADDVNNIRYNENVINLNDSVNLQLNVRNNSAQIPVAPVNTPPRIARFRLFGARVNRINVSS